MAHRTRLKYTDEVKYYIWDRYQQGDALKAIGRSCDRTSSSIHGLLSRTGGIRPRERKRAPQALSLAEREEISRGLVSGLSIRAFAAQLERAPSTVSREVERNGGEHSYRASSADQNAWDRSERPKVCKLIQNRPLCRKVEMKLRRKWSPEQIAGWLKIEFPGDEWNQVSHETIYRSLFIQACEQACKTVQKVDTFGRQLTGNEVSASSINWGAQSANSFPYRVVQMPGPSNAMGRVKFMFPNKHAIYLHDTPSRDLFSRSQRAFSAGCIRVEDPLELARVLLDDPENWSGEQIQAVVDSGAPKEVVRLQRDIDVLLMYWTVSPSSDDRVQFHPDVYQLDPPALALLNAPPRSAVRR